MPTYLCCMRLDMIAVSGIEQYHEPSVSMAPPERLRAETYPSCCPSRLIADAHPVLLTSLYFL